jgi:phosphocarrier protein HPr
MNSETTAKLMNKVGLHARPASLFVQTSRKFKCQIQVEKDGMVVDAKSILGVLSLGAEYGTVIKIRASGEDAQEAIGELSSLIQSKFGEE